MVSKDFSFHAWLRLARVEHAFIAAFAVVAAQAIVAKRFDAASISVFVFNAIAPFFITLASFVANDYFDFKSDKALRRRDRPIVSGAIAREHALYAAGALYVVGVSFALFVPAAASVVALAYAALSVAYNAWLKRLPLVGNVFIASSMAVCFVYGNLCVSQWLNYFVGVFALMSFLTGLGRELLITLRDVSGDKKIGARTLPMLLGAKRTVIAANSLVYCGVVLSFFPLFVLPSLFLPYGALIIAADALLVAVVLKTSLDQKLETLQFARNASLAALLVGTLAFASLAFA